MSHKLSNTQTRWSTIEKEAFSIHFSLQELDHYLHNAKFTIKKDHTPLKYLIDSPMQNKEILLWALGIAGYNCKIEYIARFYNSCNDLLSSIPQNAGITQDKEDYDIDIRDEAYKINALNSYRLSPKEYARCTLLPSDFIEKPTLDEIIDMVIEQAKDDTLVELKVGLQNEKVPTAVQKRHLIIDNTLYYISNMDADPILRLYISEHLRVVVIRQYNDWNGHMGIDKTYDAIKQKYY